MKRKKYIFMFMLVLIVLISTILPVKTVYASSWTDYLGEKAIEVISAFAWNETITDTSKIWDGTSTVITNIDSDGFYHATTPQEFRWALENNKNVRLDNDIDLGGRNGVDWTKIAGELTNTIDGQDNIIYNFNSTSSAMLTSGANFNIKNINFKYTRLEGKNNVGIIATSGETYSISNITVNNALIIGDGDFVAVLVSGTTSALSDSKIKNVIIKDSSAIAKSGRHHSLLAGGFDKVSVYNSATIDCTLVSYGSHSGGFIGCNDKDGYVENCFSNSTVYGNLQTAAFAGLAGYSNGVNFKNCYVSGKVEGTSDISGFAFNLGSATNCYSTAMVGMQNGGTRISGMSYENSAIGYGKKAIFKDCYVAGEIGDLSTPVNNKTDTITAFTDVSSTSNTNCYYDKQTTGMREDGEEKSVGITGVLTKDKTNTNVTYTGLTSQPGNYGFTGFSDNSEWVFKEGTYPELAVFANANKSIWGENTNLVKAYSKASVQTVYLENYEKDYKENELPFNTYDTVRDITSKFSMSDSIWKKGYNTDGTFSNKTTKINNKEYDILTLEKLNGVQWITDFAPGIEWMQVKSTVNKEIGSRIMRLCPTVNLDPGLGQTVIARNNYDHRTDALLAYTTASNLANNTLLFEGSYNQATNTANILNASSMIEIDRLAGKSGNKMHVLVYDFEVGDISPDANFTLLELKDKTQNDSEVTIPGDIDKTYTGEVPFQNTQKGFHLLEYVWELPDGRYVRNGKMITVKDVPFDIQTNVVKDITQKPTSSNLDSESVMLGSSGGNSTTVSDKRISQSNVQVNYGNAATISWEIPTNNAGNPISELLSATIRSGTDYTEWRDGQFNKELNQFEVTMYDYSIVKNTATGTYDIVSKKIDKTYPVIKNGNTYSVTFNFNNDRYKDIEDNLEINLQFKKLPNYTVKYETQGAGVIADKTNINYTDKTLLPIDILTKDGFIFNGWKYDDIIVSNTNTYKSLANDDTLASITLVAEWIKSTDYSVVYNTNGGFMPPNIPSSISGLMYDDTVPLPTPIRDGYTFKGWTYNGTSITSDSIYKSLVENDTIKQIELVAQWEIHNYYVDFKFTSTNNPKGISIPKRITVQYGSITDEPKFNTLDSWTFNGWYTDIECKQKYDFRTSIKGDMTLYGEWVYKIPGISKPEVPSNPNLPNDTAEIPKTNDISGLNLFLTSFCVSACLFLLLMDRTKKQHNL